MTPALSKEAIQAAYEQACCQEIEALKPGNVHRFADGHRMSAEQFLLSARISSEPLTTSNLGVGQRVLEAVQATRDAVRTNTNLGIILLCAPLARAAEMRGSDLRGNVRMVLDALDMDDARAVFEAIVLAEPGGLGSATAHDVREPPRIHLIEAMSEAAGRDMIARQYATGLEDIFEVGLVALGAAHVRGERGMWPAVLGYLEFLTCFPDSHVARNHGSQSAEQLREEARAVLAQFQDAASETARIEILLDFDRRLKADGLNPGTSADLTVASLFACNLKMTLHNRRVGGSISPA
jgi:triphosphoribosyl-dephospho-CoA synthase